MTRAIKCWLAVLLLGGCATMFARRPAPPPVPAAPGLDSYRDAAVNALKQFNRDLGFVTERTEVSRVYFTQADWTPGPLGRSRVAEVVFITRDSNGCAWSLWQLGQKNLGDDGWGLAALFPGPMDTDSMSCASLEPGAGAAAPRQGAPSPQPTWKSPPPAEVQAVVYAQSGESLDIAMQGKKSPPAVGDALTLLWWDVNVGTWLPLGAAKVAVIKGPKITLTVKTSVPVTNGVRLRW